MRREAGCGAGLKVERRLQIALEATPHAVVEDLLRNQAARPAEAVEPGGLVGGSALPQTDCALSSFFASSLFPRSSLYSSTVESSCYLTTWDFPNGLLSSEFYRFMRP